jgi:hypothetical protein
VILERLVVMRNLASIAVAVLLALAACRRGAPAVAPAGPTTSVPVGPSPIDVVTGDVDRDGALDLVAASPGDKTIAVRLRRGDAWTAAPGDPIATPGFAAHLIALGDLDRDGDLDLVATDHDAGAVAVWHNDGAGRFAPAAGSPFTAFAVAKPHNHGLAVADLDADGDADVVVVDQEHQAAAVLLSDAGTDAGALALAPGSPFPLGGEAYPPRLGDIDGDSRLDLVVPLIGAAAIAILLGDGTGRFHHAPGSPHATARDRPYGIALADLDRDGRLDIIAPHDDVDDVSVLLNAGAGRFRDAPGSPFDLGLRIWRPAIADVDGDGALDLIGAGSGALVIAHGDSTGRLARVTRRRADAWTAITADLDGTGTLSILTPETSAGAIRIWPLLSPPP